MSWWTASIEEFDNSLHADVAAWEGLKTYPAASYGKDFSTKSSGVMINDLLQLKSTAAMPPEAVKALLKPIVAKKMLDNGASQEEIDAIQMIIESYAPEPIAPPVEEIEETEIDDNGSS